MKSADSKLRVKKININDKMILIHENEPTKHIVKKHHGVVFFDLSKMSIGRIASEIANVVSNKYDYDYSFHHKHTYKIVLFNCNNFILTGNKLTDREYLKYTGYPGGQRSINPIDLYNKNPRTYFEKVLGRMLNKNKSRQDILNKIQYFPGEVDAKTLLMKDDNFIIQKTVDAKMNAYLNKYNGGK